MPRQAGASDEVEITPAMIGAGIDALCRSSDESVSCRPLEVLGLIVAEVYEAMDTARG